MTRRQKDPLHPLSAEEREVLERISRAHSDPASHVARAKALLAVADGASYTEAAQAAGRRSGDAVAQLVSRFNQEGLAAIEPRHGGGPPIEYGLEERKRILAEFERQPDRERDGTATLIAQCAPISYCRQWVILIVVEQEKAEKLLQAYSFDIMTQE